MLLYYNDVLLPSLPADISVEEYPYIWIRKNNLTNYYDLVASTTIYYYSTSKRQLLVNPGVEKWYRLSYDTVIDDNTTWTYYNTEYNGDYWALDANRSILWSMFDIPIDSETSTNIYYKGSPIEYPTQKKYLVRDGSTLYTVIDSTLSELTGELTSSLFQTNGIDTIPDGALLLSLTAPEVLCWTDSDEVPSLTATVTALPLISQSIIANIDISDDTVLGIKEATAEYEGNPTVLLSFDDKNTWYTFSDDNWYITTQTESGMTIDTLISITSEQWYEKIKDINNFYLKICLSSAEDKITNIIFDFIN